MSNKDKAIIVTEVEVADEPLSLIKSEEAFEPPDAHRSALVKTAEPALPRGLCFIKAESEVECSLVVTICCDEVILAFADKTPLRCRRSIGHKGMHWDSGWYWSPAYVPEKEKR